MNVHAFHTDPRVRHLLRTKVYEPFPPLLPKHPRLWIYGVPAAALLIPAAIAIAFCWMGR